MFVSVFYFLMRDRKGTDPDGREGVDVLGGAEGGKIIIRINYVRKTHLKEKELSHLRMMAKTPIL